MRDVKPSDLIFIDETGINLALVRTHARSASGLRAYGERPYQRGKNVTLVGAIALKGLVAAMTVEGGTTGEVFRAFVEQILVPSLWPGAVVVMDNLSAHKVKGIQETIEAAGAKVVYLSPYSPDFNPIENCWSLLKEYLRGVAARSRDALSTALTKGLELISPKNIISWFTHCCYCKSSVNFITIVAGEFGQFFYYSINYSDNYLVVYLNNYLIII